MQKYRLLDGKDMDLLREPCNQIWPLIQTAIYKCFGSLATVVWGGLQNDDYLIQNYITTFNVEKERDQLKEYLKNLDLQKYRTPFLEFARTHKHYVNVHLLRSFDDFDIDYWVASDKEAVLVLVGNRGVGKSTFISYLLKTIKANNDIIIFTNNLAMASTTKEALIETYVSLSEQIDRKVLEVGEAFRMGTEEILNERFSTDLQLFDAIIRQNDKDRQKEEKERRRSQVLIEQNKTKSKNSRESLVYLRSGIKFLRSKGKRMCIILDDVDRLNDGAAAEAIRREVLEISHALNIPIVISLREITVRKIGNKFGNENKYHILAPQFEDVLISRFQTFKNILRENPPNEIAILGDKYSS